VDVAFEMAGEPEALKECILSVRHGGLDNRRFGEPHGKIELDCFQDVGRKNLRLQGCGERNPPHPHGLTADLQPKTGFCRAHHPPVSFIPANEALQVMKSREAVKAVLLPFGDE